MNLSFYIGYQIVAIHASLVRWVAPLVPQNYRHRRPIEPLVNMKDPPAFLKRYQLDVLDVGKWWRQAYL